MMTATTIKQTESAPAAYPDAPSGLSTAAAALDADMLWQRIEAYTAWRWTSRAVVWTVEGCGDWHPPLTPATIATVEIWSGDAWSRVTLSPSPLGGYCLTGGMYRFTGTVGEADADVPPAALEAFRRLAEYMAADAGTAGAASQTVNIPDVETREITRAPSWMARAIANSGAGDLLRPYRRA
jgi:hypothetical protein